MKTADFDYDLPKELIAQHPAGERASSRLLVLHRQSGIREHRAFHDVASYLSAGDVLVLNESKVLPARLFGRKATGGSAEVLLVEQRGPGRWLCLVKGISRRQESTEVTFATGKATLFPGPDFWTIVFADGTDGESVMGREGAMPLPPYIKRVPRGDNLLGDSSDFERYQTVYARVEGSIAAPTAGFHFTGELLDLLTRKGVEIVKITLHIGVGTFFLVKSEDVVEHRMHAERFSVSAEAKHQILRAKSEGRRIVACGTSAVRTLETLGSGNGSSPFAGETGLFIYPGYRFTMVDALITNFHLPRSTPLLLAAAFAGHEALLTAYREAVEKGYRFYSYGDGMLIL